VNVDPNIPTRNGQYEFDFMDSRSLSSILDLAENEGKLIFVDIYTSWCLPCKMMDKNVFNNAATADIINENFISYKVDAEKFNGPDLALIFDVSQYPTLLFLDSKGRVLEKGLGSHSHAQLIELADSALSKVQVME